MRLFSKMFSFQGRDTRGDFLAYIGLSVLFAVMGAPAGLLLLADLPDPLSEDAWTPDATGTGLIALLGLLVLVIAVIRFLSTCRRFRDTGSSPWLALLLFVPPLGGLATLALIFIRSAPGQPLDGLADVF